MTVAETILHQLGGTRFIAMTGADNFVGGETTLIFRIPASLTKNRGNRIRVTLDGNDFYKIEYMKIRTARTVKNPFVILDTREHIDVSKLRLNFTNMTGLDTSL